MIEAQKNLQLKNKVSKDTKRLGRTYLVNPNRIFKITIYSQS